MTPLQVSGPARRDIIRILRRSRSEFGDEARRRYQALIDQALQDLGEDAARIGVRPIEEVRKGHFIYHLKWSRPRFANPVRRPRHLIAFYFADSGAIVVARVFHERQMLARHLADQDDN